MLSWRVLLCLWLRETTWACTAEWRPPTLQLIFTKMASLLQLDIQEHSISPMFLNLMKDSTSAESPDLENQQRAGWLSEVRWPVFKPKQIYISQDTKLFVFRKKWQKSRCCVIDNCLNCIENVVWKIMAIIRRNNTEQKINMLASAILTLWHRGMTILVAPSLWNRLKYVNSHWIYSSCTERTNFNKSHKLLPIFSSSNVMRWIFLVLVLCLSLTSEDVCTL